MFPELYFKMIFKIIKEQNENLLHDISVCENISLKELHNKYLPKLHELRTFIRSK